MIRFRLEEGVEPFQDLIFGWNRHEVAQVGILILFKETFGQNSFTRTLDNAALSAF